MINRFKNHTWSCLDLGAYSLILNDYNNIVTLITPKLYDRFCLTFNINKDRWWIRCIGDIWATFSTFSNFINVIELGNGRGITYPMSGKCKTERQKMYIFVLLNNFSFFDRKERYISVLLSNFSSFCACAKKE